VSSPPAAPRRRRWLGTVAAAGLPLALYLRTMAPTVYGLDSAELTTGAYALGIVHAPGSPLYLLIGHLFTWLPIGDVGFRLNLMSACASALTAAFLYAILTRLTGAPAVALGTAWFVASTYYVWVGGVAAELYGPQGCIVALLILLALEWRRRGRPWLLFALAFGFGLGLGNHLSLILLGPGFACLALTRGDVWRRPRVLAGALLAMAIGACIFLYLPLRQHAHPALDYARDYWQADLTTWRGFWWMVSGRMFSVHFFSVPLHEVPAEIILYTSRLWSNFMGIGLLLGVVGLVDDLRRRPVVEMSLLLMFILHVAFFVSYGASDKELMFLPTYIIWGIWMGLGAAVARDELRRATKGGWSLLVPSVVFLMAAGNVIVNFRFVDASTDWFARQRGEAILQTVEPDAVYFGTWVDVPIVEYLQVVEGLRPDVATVNLVFVGEAERKRLVYAHAAAGRPVYASAPLAIDDTTLRFDYLAHCDCYRLRTEAVDRCGLP
jgi:Protein O-mannosyl-transferase TMEM260-like